MLTADFDYAQQFISQIHERNRPVVTGYFEKFDQLTAENAMRFYEARAAEDTSAADREFEVLQSLGQKMGITLTVPEVLAERRRVQAAELKIQLAKIRERNEQRRTTTGVIFFVILVALVGGMYWVVNTVTSSVASVFQGDSHSTHSLDSQLKAQGIVLLGHTATVTEDFPCAGTSDGEQQAVQAVSTGDKQGFAEAIASSGGFMLQRGSRVRAIDTAGALSTLSRFRVESGSHASEACWLPTDIKIFTNIK